MFQVSLTLLNVIISGRAAVDPHSIFADLDPDLAVFLNGNSNPAAFLMRIRL